MPRRRALVAQVAPALSSSDSNFRERLEQAANINSLLLSTEELLKRFHELTGLERELSDLNDDATAIKAKWIVDLERRYDNGDRGGHNNCENWCIEHVPEHSWSWITRLRKWGKAADIREAVRRGREDNNAHNSASRAR